MSSAMRAVRLACRHASLHASLHASRDACRTADWIAWCDPQSHMLTNQPGLLPNPPVTRLGSCTCKNKGRPAGTPVTRSTAVVEKWFLLVFKCRFRLLPCRALVVLVPSVLILPLVLLLRSVHQPAQAGLSGHQGRIRRTATLLEGPGAARRRGGGPGCLGEWLGCGGRCGSRR